MQSLKSILFTGCSLLPGLLAVVATGCDLQDEPGSDFEDGLLERGLGLDPIGLDPIGDAKEVCDCVDNDGDGLVDEHLDCMYNVGFQVAADDSFDLYVDGSYLGGASNWMTLTTVATMLPTGYHDVMIEAWDLHGVQAGLLASISVPGQIPMQYDTGTFVWDISNIECPAPILMPAPPALPPPPSFPPYIAVSNWGGAHGTTAHWVWNAVSNDPETYPYNCARTVIDVCPQAAAPCRGECIEGGYCDNEACCIVPDDCVCYEPTHPVSLQMCGVAGM